MENAKPIAVTQYGLLSLVTASMYLNNTKFIIRRNELEKNLYKYYKDDKYKILFEDVIARKYIDDLPFVDLSEAFINALAWGLLVIIQDGSADTKYIINIPNDEEAENLLMNYPENIRNLATSMIKDMEGPERKRAA